MRAKHDSVFFGVVESVIKEFCNVIDSINGTHKFSFPLDPALLVNLETGFRAKIR